MSIWAQVADVIARVTYTEISATSAPNTAQVQRWLDEAEAQIKTTITSRGEDWSQVTSDGALVLGSWATDYAHGRLLDALSSARDLEPLLEVDRDPLQTFRANIAMLRNGSIAVLSEVLPGGDLTNSSTAFRSWVTDDASVPDDYAHNVTMAEVID